MKAILRLQDSAQLFPSSNPRSNFAPTITKPSWLIQNSETSSRHLGLLGNPINFLHLSEMTLPYHILFPQTSHTSSSYWWPRLILHWKIRSHWQWTHSISHHKTWQLGSSASKFSFLHNEETVPPPIRRDASPLLLWVPLPFTLSKALLHDLFMLSFSSHISLFIESSPSSHRHVLIFPLFSDLFFFSYNLFQFCPIFLFSFITKFPRTQINYVYLLVFMPLFNPVRCASIPLLPGKVSNSCQVTKSNGLLSHFSYLASQQYLSKPILYPFEACLPLGFQDYFFLNFGLRS